MEGESVTWLHNVASVLTQQNPDETMLDSSRMLINDLTARDTNFILRNDSIVIPRNAIPLLNYKCRVRGIDPSCINIFFTDNLDEVAILREFQQEIEGTKINPYIGNLRLGKVMTDLNIKSMQQSPEQMISGVSWKANNKALLFRYMQEEGLTHMNESQRKIIEINEKAAGAIVNHLFEQKKIFIKSSNSGGGDGNVDLYITDEGLFVSNSLKFQYTSVGDVLSRIDQWVKAQKFHGSSHIISEIFLNIITSPSQTAFLFENGDLTEYGYNDQVLDANNAYLGIDRQRNGGNLDYQNDVRKYFKEGVCYLKSLGFTGNFGVDFMVYTHKDINNGYPVVEIAEINARRTGAMPPLSSASFYAGISDLRYFSDAAMLDISILSDDHVMTHAGSIEELIKLMLENDLPLAGYTKGSNGPRVEIMTVVGNSHKKNINGKKFQVGLSFYGYDQEQVHKLASLVKEAI